MSTTLARIPHTPAARKKVERVLHEFKHGALYTRGGQRVKSRRQAVRIALEEARRNPRRRHRRNPEHETAHTAAYVLLGLGALLLLMPRQSYVPGGVVATGVPSLSSIAAPFGGLWNTVSGWFSSSPSSGAASPSPSSAYVPVTPGPPAIVSPAPSSETPPSEIPISLNAGDPAGP